MARFDVANWAAIDAGEMSPVATTLTPAPGPGLGDGDGEGDGLGEALGEGDGLGEGVGEGLGEGEGQGLLGRGLHVGEGSTATVDVTDGE